MMRRDFTADSPGKLSFEGTSILITGAGRGIGRAYAELLASRGAQVVVNDLGIGTDGAKPSANPADEVVSEIRKAGGRAVANYSDVTSQGGGAAAVEAALVHFGRLDAVINNAGFVRSAPFAEMKMEDLDAMLDVHVRGTVRVSQAAWSVMEAQRYGRIIMTTSCGGLYGQLGLAAYAAAKGAIVGLVRVMGLEGRAHGIRVNAIAPLAYTRLAADIPDPEHRAKFERFARTEQVAPLVALLAHAECPATGQVFDAGAGRFSRVFIAEGRGYLDPSPSIESVRDHFAEVIADDDGTAPEGANEAVQRTVELMACKLP